MLPDLTIGTVQVYGYSDDLVEVDGDANEEFSYHEEDDPGVLIAGGTGELIVVRPRFDDCWANFVLIVSEGTSGAVKVNAKQRVGGQPGDTETVIQMPKPIVVFRLGT